MVSVIEPPAASVTLTRSVTSAPGGAVKPIRKPPARDAVTEAGCQVRPSSKDTVALALVTGAALASWR